MATYDPALYDDSVAGGDFDMAKKIFAANALEIFKQETLAWPLITKEALTGAVSKEFIKYGALSAEAHTPGATITGQTMTKDTVLIRLEDKETIAYANQSKRDALISHWDHAGALAKEAGSALAQTFDKHTLQQAILAAQTAADSVGPGGQALTSPRSAGGGTIALEYPVSSDGSKMLQDDIAEIVQKMREDNVPESEQIYCFLKYREHRVLRQDDSLLSYDFTDGQFSDKLKGKLTMVENCIVIPTNNFPQTDLSANTWPTIGGSVAYDADFRKCVAVLFTKQALAAVYAEGITAEWDWIPQTRVWQIGAAAMKGIGTYRQECAGYIAIA